MGQVFSLEHSLGDGPSSVKAIMLLTYERGALEPISFLDFAKAPVSYSTNPILMIEPFDGVPPTLASDEKQDKLSHTDLLRTVHQNFKITPYQFKTFRLWLLHSNTISQALIKEVIDFSRTFPFTDYNCSLSIDSSSIFYDSKNVTSLSAALRPPSAGFRVSSPVRPPTQLTTTTNQLLLRRSQQTSCIQTTFMNTPTIDLVGNNAMSGGATGTNAYDQVDEGLFIGSEIAAQNRELLTEIGITHIVNLNGHNTIAAFPEGFQYYTVKMSDSVFEDLEDDFWAAVDFTKRAINGGGKVLVHCRLGISRSAALCVAYLMDKKKLTFDSAFAVLKSKRPAVNINQGFVEQLKSKEQMSKTAPFRPLSRGKPPLLKLRI